MGTDTGLSCALKTHTGVGAKFHDQHSIDLKAVDQKPADDYNKNMNYFTHSFCVYTIENTITKDTYVGFSANLQARIHSHFRNIAKGNEKLYRAMRKYGPEVFTIRVQFFNNIHTAALYEYEGIQNAAYNYSKEKLNVKNHIKQYAHTWTPKLANENRSYRDKWKKEMARYLVNTPRIATVEMNTLEEWIIDLL